MRMGYGLSLTRDQQGPKERRGMPWSSLTCCYNVAKVRADAGRPIRWFARAAITIYHSPDGLNNSNLFSYSSVG